MTLFVTVLLLLTASVRAMPAVSPALSDYFHQLEQSSYPKTQELLGNSWMQCDSRTVDVAHELPAFEAAIATGNPAAIDAAIKIALRIIRFRGDQKTADAFAPLAGPLQAHFWDERPEPMIVNGEKHGETTFGRAEILDFLGAVRITPPEAVTRWVVSTLDSTTSEYVTLTLEGSLARLDPLPEGAALALVNRAREPNGARVRSAALAALGQHRIAEPRVMLEVRVALDDNSALLRAAAATAAGDLYMIDTKSKLKALASNDSDGGVRRASVAALADLE